MTGSDLNRPGVIRQTIKRLFEIPGRSSGSESYSPAYEFEDNTHLLVLYITEFLDITINSHALPQTFFIKLGPKSRT